MKTVLRVIFIQGAVLCPLMELIEGDPAGLCAPMRGLGGMPSHTVSLGLPPRAVDLLARGIKEGAGSGGNLQGQPQGQGRAGVKTQQTAAIVDKCHAAEHGALTEAI